MQVTKWLLVEAEKWLSTTEQGWFGALVTAVGSLKPPRVSVFQSEAYIAGHLALITTYQALRMDGGWLEIAAASCFLYLQKTAARYFGFLQSQSDHK